MANETETMLRPRFSCGQVVATRGADELLQGDLNLVHMLLMRHMSGDSGDTCQEDKEINEDAIRYGNRVMSVYKLVGGRIVWVITEADRSVTTFLLPEEY